MPVSEIRLTMLKLTIRLAISTKKLPLVPQVSKNDRAGARSEDVVFSKEYRFLDKSDNKSIRIHLKAKTNVAFRSVRVHRQFNRTLLPFLVIFCHPVGTLIS